MFGLDDRRVVGHGDSGAVGNDLVELWSEHRRKREEALSVPVECGDGPVVT